MAYETGTSVNVADLCDKIRIFCLANGFTVNQYADSAVERYLRMELNGKFYNIAVDLPAVTNQHVEISLSSGYTGSTSHNSQPDESLVSRSNLLSPILSYHFFWDGIAFFCTTEIASGRYRHFGFGEINKYGGWLGGEFAVGTYFSPGWSHTGGSNSLKATFPFDCYSNSYNDGKGVIRADHVSAYQYRYFHPSALSSEIALGVFRTGSTNPNTTTNFYDYGSTQGIVYDIVNAYNNRTIMLPVYCFADNGADRFFTLGHVESCRRTSLDNYTPGATVTLGADEWMVFPLAQKNGGAGQENTGYDGIAFKKVP